MATATMQATARLTLQAGSASSQKVAIGDAYAKGLGSPSGKANFGLRNLTEKSQLQSQRIQTPRFTQRRPSSMTVCVAAPANTEISVEERKQAEEEADAAKSFKIIEVEFTSPVDFNAAKVLEVNDVAPGVRCITVDAEISREFVTLDKAYTRPGQKVEVRLPSGDIAVVPACSAAFPTDTNHAVLMKARGDIFAGSTKAAQYGLSVKAPLDLHVSEASSPALFRVQPGTEVEIGPFQPGMDFRPIMFLTRFPTILLFATGDGIAAMRALIEAKDVGSLYLSMREDARLYYSAPSPSHLAYKDLWSTWEQKGIKLRPTVNSAAGEAWDGFVGSFAELFDEDDLEYDPETTGAVVCGSKAANDEVMKLLDDAGLSERTIIRWDM